MAVSFEEWRFTTGHEPATSSRDEWVYVETSTASQPFSVRLARQGGRLRIIGIALDNGEEVTTDVLRSLRLGQVLAEFFDQEDEVDALALGGFVDALSEAPPRAVRARRGRPPSDEDLRRFVEAYRRELSRHPRKAMHEVTKKGGPVPMARSTGYRWLMLARERGLIDEDDT